MANETIGTDTTASTGTLVTADSADTKGTYVQLVASTARESHRLQVTIKGAGDGAKGSYRVFLSTGAAASEVDFMSFIFWSGSGQGDSLTFEIPFTIAASQRIACAASQGISSGTTFDISVNLCDTNTLGTSTELSTVGITGTNDGFKGTPIDPGGTANTKGSWTQIVASTSHDFDMMVVCIAANDNNNLTASKSLIDIGTGASSSEVVLIGDINHQQSSFEDGITYFTIYEAVASGTRIAARSQCSITDATDRMVDVSIIGVNVTAPAGGGGGGSWGFFG
jgi:hypothetical protein